VLSPAGYTVECPTDVLSWARGAQRTLVLLTLASERSLDILRQFRDMGGATHFVVALLEENASALGVTAVRSGARSVLWRDVAPGRARQEMLLDPADVVTGGDDEGSASYAREDPCGRVGLRIRRERPALRRNVSAVRLANTVAVWLSGVYATSWSDSTRRVSSRRRRSALPARSFRPCRLRARRPSGGCCARKPPTTATASV
jgi:hypothetical protein